MTLRSILNTLFSQHKKMPRQIIIGQPAAISQTMDASMISSVLRAAEGGDMSQFHSLARDIVSGHGHTLTEFGKRKLAVLGQPLTITSGNKKDPISTALAAQVHDHITELPSLMDAMLHLLDSTIYPVSVVQKIYKPSARKGWRYELAELRPVPYHCLDYTTGHLRIQQTDDSGQLLGRFQDPDPLGYIIHRGHILRSAPDTWGGPMRSILFWWLFATQDRDWWVRFLERFGAPFMVGKYDETSPETRGVLQQAFSAATRLFGIAIPNDADVQIIQANSNQGGEAFQQFQKFANNEISKIILGQTSSGDIQSSGGLGSGGQAKAQSDVRDDIRLFDSVSLSATLLNQIIRPLFEFNSWPVVLPTVNYGAEDSSTVDSLSQAVQRGFESGLELTDEGLDSYNKSVGLPFRRVAAGMPQSLSQLSAAPSPVVRPALVASDRIAAAAASNLSTNLALTLAPLRAIVDSATDLRDLEIRLAAAFPTLDHHLAADVAMLALTANTLNAAENFPTLPS